MQTPQILYVEVETSEARERIEGLILSVDEFVIQSPKSRKSLMVLAVENAHRTYAELINNGFDPEDIEVPHVQMIA